MFILGVLEMIIDSNAHSLYLYFHIASSPITLVS